MIRNTRANAGINLPPRRAETVLFEPDGDERAFWQSCENELRAELGQLPASQSSLWGRLLLQATVTVAHRGASRAEPARFVPRLRRWFAAD